LKPAARLLPVGQVALALGCSVRTVHREVVRGALAPPVLQQRGRNLWRPDDVERCRAFRVEARPRQYHRGPAIVARRALKRLRQDQAVVVRAFLTCWRECGIETAIDAVRRHGAIAGLRNMEPAQLGAMVVELEHLARLVRAHQ
jgi:hypothetical protein